METLRNLRSHERIKVIEGFVDDKSKTAYVTVELQKRDGAILVFMNHSDDIVELVLSEVDPSDSGYMFFASELLVDPINSNMVPKHRLATAEEITDLANRHIPFNKLPILRMLDTVRRWHNFKQGSIVAIDRESGTYFRRVS